MAEFTYIDLKRAWESRDWTQWKLARELGVSEDTVQRWGSDNAIPTPDDVWNIEKTIKAPGIWHRWMLSHFDSYRHNYIGMPVVGHIAADVLRFENELSHAIPLIPSLKVDAIDGVWNDAELCKRCRKELLDIIESARQILDTMPQGRTDK